MDRRQTIRDGLAAARHLRQLARVGGVTPRDLDRLLGKIDAGLEAGMDVVQLAPPPAAVDFAETVARMVAQGLPLTRGSLLRQPVPPPRSLMDWSAPEPGLRGREGRVVIDELQDPEVADQVARLRALIDRCPDRVRTVGGLAVIDGDRP